MTETPISVEQTNAPAVQLAVRLCLRRLGDRSTIRLALLAVAALAGPLAGLGAGPAAADVFQYGKSGVTAHIATDFRHRPQAQPLADNAGTAPKAPADIRALIEDAATTHGLDVALVEAVVAVESGFQIDAVSAKGAVGLMQLMPETAAELGVADPWDARANIDGGVRYLKRLLGRYGGDRPLALAAYNAGMRAVDSYGGVPPYPETREYILRINARLAGNAQVPAPNPVALPVETSQPGARAATAPLIVFGSNARRVEGVYRIDSPDADPIVAQPAELIAETRAEPTEDIGAESARAEEIGIEETGGEDNASESGAETAKVDVPNATPDDVLGDISDGASGGTQRAGADDPIVPELAVPEFIVPEAAVTRIAD